jgi:hypothetical protein
LIYKVTEVKNDVETEVTNDVLQTHVPCGSSRASTVALHGVVVVTSMMLTKQHLAVSLIAQ